MTVANMKFSENPKNVKGVGTDILDQLVYKRKLQDLEGKERNIINQLFSDHFPASGDADLVEQSDQEDIREMLKLPTGKTSKATENA